MKKIIRKDYDDYPTPDYLWKSIFLNNYMHLYLMNNIDKNTLIFDPCCGNKNMLAVLEEVLDAKLDCVSNDIQRKYECDSYADASKFETFEKLFSQKKPDFIFTNPPFKLSHEILENSLKIAKKGVGFILRLSFLEPVEKRKNLLIEYKPDILLITKRVCFDPIKRNTESVTSCFMFFDKIIQRESTVLDYIDNDTLLSNGKEIRR